MSFSQTICVCAELGLSRSLKGLKQKALYAGDISILMVCENTRHQDEPQASSGESDQQSQKKPYDRKNVGTGN